MDKGKFRLASRAAVSMDTNQLGFHNLPFLAHRKSVKRGFEFTLMVVGKSWGGLEKRPCTKFVACFVCSGRVAKKNEASLFWPGSVVYDIKNGPLDPSSLGRAP